MNSQRKTVTWTDPHGLIAGKATCLLYFVRLTDEQGVEYRYVGKTKNGSSRLREYRQNIAKIFAGRPRRTTPGQEKYRAIHLALAKACELGWSYEFYPLEGVELQRLAATEKLRISELLCNLNNARSWRVEEFHTLTLRELVRRSACDDIDSNATTFPSLPGSRSKGTKDADIT